MKFFYLKTGKSASRSPIYVMGLSTTKRLMHTYTSFNCFDLNKTA